MNKTIEINPGDLYFAINGNKPIITRIEKYEFDSNDPCNILFYVYSDFNNNVLGYYIEKTDEIKLIEKYNFERVFYNNGGHQSNLRKLESSIKNKYPEYFI